MIGQERVKSTQMEYAGGQKVTMRDVKKSLWQ